VGSLKRCHPLTGGIIRVPFHLSHSSSMIWVLDSGEILGKRGAILGNAGPAEPMADSDGFDDH